MNNLRNNRWVRIGVIVVLLAIALYVYFTL